MNKYMTLNQVQEVLPLSKSSIMRHLKENDVECIKIKRRLLFLVDDVESMISTHRHTPDDITG